MADILADAQRWLDSLATRTDAVEAAQDAVWVIEQSIAEIERLRAIEAAAREAARTLYGRTDECYCRPCWREGNDSETTHIDTDGCLYCAAHASPSSLPLLLLREKGGAK